MIGDWQIGCLNNRLCNPESIMIQKKESGDSWVSMYSLIINKSGSEHTQLPRRRWCHWTSLPPIDPLLLWMRRVIQAANGEHWYVHTPDMTVVAVMLMCIHERERMFPWGMRVCLSTHVCVCVCYFFIDCVKVFVRIMSLWGQTFFFYHSNDLTQLELRLMRLAFFRVLTFRSAYLCVRVCVFVEENITRSEPAASPAGLKFACFPPSCSAQPNQRQHCLLVCS